MMHQLKAAFSLAIFLSFFSPLLAQTSTQAQLLNPGFEEVDAEKPTLPKSWKLDGEAPDYALDKQHKRSGTHSLRVAYKPGAPYAGTIQSLSIKPQAGKTIQISTYIMRGSKEGKTGLWAGVFDAEKKRLIYVNTYDEPYASTEGWVKHSLKITVPEKAERLLIGAAAYGETNTLMWVDDFNIEQLEKNKDFDATQSISLLSCPLICRHLLEMLTLPLCA
jgi:hypothetical protein